MRVLLVEHDAEQARLTVEALRREGLDCVVAEDEAAGARALSSLGPFHIMVLDYSVPSVCLDFLRHVRQAYRHLPALLLLPSGQADVAPGALRAGVVDYLVKSPDMAHLCLLPSALRRVRRATLQRPPPRHGPRRAEPEPADADDDLRHLILVDPLTGLYNRRFLPEALKREFAASSRYGHPLSCAMADLDHFKEVNDSHGHMCGDEVLRGITCLIKNCFREPDIAFRFGGEEFIILLPHTGEPAALTACQRFLEQMRAQPMNTSQGAIDVRASVGLACLQNDNFGTSEELIAAADAALYQAKRGGRDCVVVARAGRRQTDPAEAAA